MASLFQCNGEVMHHASCDGNKVDALLLFLHGKIKFRDKVKENVPALKMAERWPPGYTNYFLTPVVTRLSFIHNLYTSS